MRTFTIAAIIAMLTVPAFAQRAAGPAMPNPHIKTEADKAAEEKQRKLDEKAYKDSISRIPDRDQKLDPWGKVR
jgi:hypothetical protein